MPKYYKYIGGYRVSYLGIGLIRMYKPKGFCCFVNPMTNEIQNCTEGSIDSNNRDSLLEIAKDFARSLDVYKQGKYKIKEQ